MLSVFLVTLVVMLVLVAAMAVGVIFGREPLKGSCGGLNAVGLNGECKICGRTTGPCEGPEGGSATETKKVAEKAARLGKPVS